MRDIQHTDQSPQTRHGRRVPNTEHQQASTPALSRQGHYSYTQIEEKSLSPIRHQPTAPRKLCEA